jgi:hypothetical protein
MTTVLTNHQHGKSVVIDRMDFFGDDPVAQNAKDDQQIQAGIKEIGFADRRRKPAERRGRQRARGNQHQAAMVFRLLSPVNGGREHPTKRDHVPQRNHQD